MSQSQERRRHRRLAISADAILTIMIPEQTFSANSVRAVATDVSTSGLRLKTYQLGKEDYLSLIRGVRYAKIDLTLPFYPEPVPLKAKIVWVGFHDATSHDKAHVDLGVMFENLPEESQKRIQEAIDRLSSQTVSPGEVKLRP